MLKKLSEFNQLFFDKIDTASPPLEKSNGSKTLIITTFLPYFANFKIRSLVSA